MGIEKGRKAIERADVAAQAVQLDAGFEQAFLKLVEGCQFDADRLEGLLAGGAAGGEDPERGMGLARLEAVGEGDLGEGLEMLGNAEEVGFADGEALGDRLQSRWRRIGSRSPSR